MNSFGFPSSANYAQSQVSSNAGYETNYNQVENGGLFTREECRNLARYDFLHAGKSLTPMMEMETGFVRRLKWPNGWSTATEPWIAAFPQPQLTSLPTFRSLTRTKMARCQGRSSKNSSSSISSMPTEQYDFDNLIADIYSIVSNKWYRLLDKESLNKSIFYPHSNKHASSNKLSNSASSHSSSISKAPHN